ncbi:MAG: hypothetical protein JW915_00885 [Chitinispirillaceae bacterium]|nr:hypothetical protein [Chitinispirillaceae bacterium]
MTRELVENAICESMNATVNSSSSGLSNRENIIRDCVYVKWIVTGNFIKNSERQKK